MFARINTALPRSIAGLDRAAVTGRAQPPGRRGIGRTESPETRRGRSRINLGLLDFPRTARGRFLAASNHSPRGRGAEQYFGKLRPPLRRHAPLGPRASAFGLARESERAARNLHISVYERAIQRSPDSTGRSSPPPLSFRLRWTSMSSNYRMFPPPAKFTSARDRETVDHGRPNSIVRFWTVTADVQWVSRGYGSAGIEASVLLQLRDRSSRAGYFCSRLWPVNR